MLQPYVSFMSQNVFHNQINFEDYTMTCMTSVGFGNVASETDNEKIFSIFMMVISGRTKISSSHPNDKLAYKSECPNADF